MELVKRRNLHNTIIELDAKAIVDAVHGQKEARTQWGAITTQCAKWVKESVGISVVWTRRSGNKVAHKLAKWAGIEPNRE
jgi:hypothetical protein